MAELLVDRHRLPVPGSWMCGRRGDVVIIVFDENVSDSEMAAIVELIKWKLSLDPDGDRPLFT